jgi:hypothetical protein
MDAKGFIMTLTMGLIVSSALWWMFFILLTDERKPRKGEGGKKR